MRTLERVLNIIGQLDRQIQTLTADLDPIANFNESECCEIIDKLEPLLTNLLGGVEVEVAIEANTGEQSDESISGDTQERGTSQEAGRRA